MKHFRYALIALLVVALAACDTVGGGVIDPPNGDEPAPDFLIRNVVFDPAVVSPGQSAILSWEADGEDVLVEVEPLGQTFNGSGSVTVTAEATTDYVVTASREGSEPERTELTLIVDGYTPGDGTASLEVIITTRDGAAAVYANPFVQNHIDLPSYTSDPFFDEMEGIFLAGLTSVWLLPHDGNTVTVAYLGDGVRVTHEDIDHDILRDGWDFCPNATCSGPGSSDIDNSNPDAPFPGEYALGTPQLGSLIALNDNAMGIPRFSDRYGDILTIIPLKIRHSEPVNDPDRGNSMGRAVPFITPAAFIDALSYALGEDSGNEELGQLEEAADIIFLAETFWAEPSAHEHAELMGLFEKAARQGVLFITSARAYLEHAGEGVNHFARYAEEFKANILAVETASNRAANVDVYSTSQSATLSPYEDSGYGSYEGISMMVGVAALLQYHDPSLRGTSLHDRMIEFSFDPVPDGGYIANPDDPNDSVPTMTPGSVRADSALGLPGPGAEVTVQILDADHEVVDQQAGTLDVLGRLSVTLNAPPGEYTIAATAKGREHTLFGEAPLDFRGAYELPWVTLDTLLPD